METKEKDICNHTHSQKVAPHIRIAFLSAFGNVQELASRTAHEKGWWDAPVNDPAQIALMHTELSEAIQALRSGNPADDHIPEFSALEAELADCILRIMTYADKRGLRVAEAIIAKAEFNVTRPRMHGGKAF